jgi:hypothetical protein
VIKGGDVLEINSGSFYDCNPNIVFKSGKVGFDLKIYIDEAKTKELASADFKSYSIGKLYLEFIDNSPTPENNDFDELPIWNIIMIVLAVVGVAMVVGIFIILKRK